MIRKQSNALPTAYALRQTLNDEVHSRPTEALWPQERVFHIALLTAQDTTRLVFGALQQLIDYCGCKPYSDEELAAPQVNLSLSSGEHALRLRYEKHNEFITFTFFERADHAMIFDMPVTRRLPPGWLAA